MAPESETGVVSSYNARHVLGVRDMTECRPHGNAPEQISWAGTLHALSTGEKAHLGGSGGAFRRLNF
jgi:hypothetical protein